MLALHYAIPLNGADRVTAVRTRIAERGRLFDGMAGLVAKLFLIDPTDPCYATFYLWRDPDAALGFLEGPLFKALSEAFGRPEVKLLLTAAADIPFTTGDALSFQTNPANDALGSLRALDPRRGEVFVPAPASAAERRFEVVYRADGAAS
jgi:hypothetical protein